MTQNAEQHHLVKSIILQCCQPFEKFLCIDRSFSGLDSNTHLAVVAGSFIWQLQVGYTKCTARWASVKSFVGSGSCKNSPIAAEEESSWPELHNKFILLMVFNLVAGMVETFDNIFLAEKFKSLAVPSVCGNDSFWNSNRADLWELLCFLLAQLGLPVAHTAELPAWSFGWRCQDRAPNRTSPSLLCFHPAILDPFEKPAVSRSHWWLLETKPWLSYISKTILISSPVGSFAISLLFFRISC